MEDRHARRAQTRARRRRRWLARALAVLGLAAGIVLAGTQIAEAAPAPPSPVRAPQLQPFGPNTGSLPTAGGPVDFPAQPQPSAPLPTDVVGPLAAQIFSESTDTERLGEQLKSLDDQIAAATLTANSAKAAWDRADAYLAAIKANADSVAAQAYQQADALGPFANHADDLQKLGLVDPALPSQVDGASRLPDTIGTTLHDAITADESAKAAYEDAAAVLADLTSRRGIVAQQFAQHQAALTTLRARNADALAQAETARNAFDESLNASQGLSISIGGSAANPLALRAVAFALAQLGKPYVWATEGPNTYDCSGLVLAAYQSVGIHMPRVANDQYLAGTPVPVSQLLPGDLLFFSTDRSNERLIHHVAMYIGNGKVVEAPMPGEFVQISSIWWSEFYGATRLVPAVSGPAKPKPTATPTPTPTATPTPTPTPTPTDTPTATPTDSSPSTPADPTTTATTDPPTPTDSPTTTPPSDSPPASPTTSPTSTPTPTPSAPTSPDTSTSALPPATLTPPPTTAGRRQRWHRRPTVR
jgi:cell wall-associated NlpC family hydrolase